MLFFRLSICLLTLSACNIAWAQGPLKRAKGVIEAASKLNDDDDDSRLKRKDVEGTIWEFKIMDNREKDKSLKTKATGRIRIKQNSVFAVGKVESSSDSRTAEDLLKDFDKSGDGLLNVQELDQLLAAVRKQQTDASSGMEGELKGLFAQKVKKASEEDTGAERIGDLTKSSPTESRFRFDEDDSHPLSGIVLVRKDTKSRNGVWFGYYDEYADGKKIARWRIEMRKIEE